MSNLRTRTRRRRDHEALRGGSRTGRAFVASHQVALDASAATRRVHEAVRAATGIMLVDGGGERVEGFFRALVVSATVTPTDASSSLVEVRVRERGRNTGIALVLYVVAAVTIVPFLVLLARGATGARARERRQRAVGEAILDGLRRTG